jgi:hypothetical protein
MSGAIKSHQEFNRLKELKRLSSQENQCEDRRAEWCLF